MYGTSPSHPYDPVLVPPAHPSGSDYALAGPTTSSSTGPYRQPSDSPFPPPSAGYPPPASFEPTTAMAFAHASHFVRLHSYVPSGIPPEARLESQQRARVPRPDQLPTPPSSDPVPIELSVYCTLYVAALQDPSLPPGAKSIRLCFGEHPVATRVARRPPPPSSEVDPNEPPGASQDLFLTCNIPTNAELLAADSHLLRKGLHPEEISRIPLYCEILGGAMGTAEESVLERVWFGEFDFGGGGGIGAVKSDDRTKLSIGGWSDGRQSSGALISYGQPSLHGVPPPTRLPTTSFRPPPSPVTSGVARGERRRPRADHHPYDGRTSKKIVSPSFYSTSGFGPPSHFMVSIDPSALQAGRGAGPGSYSYSPEPSAQYEYPDLNYQHLPSHSEPSSSNTSLATPCSPPPTYHSPSAPGPSPTTSTFPRTSSLPQGSPSMPDEPAPVPSPIERNSPAKSGYGYGVKAQGATRASLQLDGDLFSMAVEWTQEEWTARRRLVRFWRTMEGPVIRASFQAIAPTEYHEDSIIVSCIFREETNECYVTSVDAIYLLEALVGSRFSIEEKNRVRRNLEQCKPDTVSKTKAETEVFFKLIMSFERPRPRNIEKDVKVFKWREFGPALVKSIAKYTVSADRTATH